MPNPEAKVSEKVRELAETLNERYDLFLNPVKLREVSWAIQTDLRELLEAGRECADADRFDFVDKQHELAAILSNWEPPQ